MKGNQATMIKTFREIKISVFKGNRGGVNC